MDSSRNASYKADASDANLAIINFGSQNAKTYLTVGSGTKKKKYLKIKLLILEFPKSMVGAKCGWFSPYGLRKG